MKGFENLGQPENYTANVGILDSLAAWLDGVQLNPVLLFPHFLHFVHFLVYDLV